MKVLFFTSGMAPEFGGAAISESSLCASLQSQTELTIACRRERMNSDFARSFGLDSFLLFRALDLLPAFFTRRGPLVEKIKAAEIVHLNGHWRWEYFFVGLLCRWYRTPYLVHPRGMMLVGQRRARLKKVFNFLIGNSIIRGASRVISLSRFETRQFVPYRILLDKIAVIPNGIVGLGDTPPPVIPPPDNYFLYIGRLEARKNILFLVDAFKRYVQRSGPRNLVFRGPVEHGYDKEIRARIGAQGLTARVELAEPSYGRDKWQHLGRACAVVYPCLEEAFGRVPFEALLAGSLPILPRESGGAEYLAPLLPECIYSTDEEGSLADALRRIERLDAAVRREKVETGRKWVEENLHWREVTRQVLALYAQVAQANAYELSPA